MVSLIISTYNRPDALHVCLDSVFKQTVFPDEIIIGDDGSTHETRLVIEEFQQRKTIPIHHIWHEDTGFRLAKMRNKCIAQTKGEYIIQIDGDVMLHPDFVKDHIAMSEKGCYIKGGRVNLTRHKTERICKKGCFVPVRWYSIGIADKRMNCIHALGCAKYLSLRYRKHTSPALGCNMSFWKKDLIKINGYDEFYEGWGEEDYDIAYRLLRNGCKKKYMKFSGIQYHLWHEDKFMYNSKRNKQYLDRPIAEKPIFCKIGLSQHM